MVSKRKINKLMRIIDDIQGHKCPEIIRENHDMKEMVDSTFHNKYVWILCIAAIPSILYACSSDMQSFSFVVLCLLGGFIPLGFIIFCVMMLNDDANAQRAVDLWFDGAYRDSEWYKGLDDDGKADAIGTIESESYGIINNRIRDLQPINKYDMWYAISNLNDAIDRDTTLLNEGSAMLNDDDRLELRSMIAKYESYRDALEAKTYEEKLPSVASGSTDMDQSAEHELIQAVDEYNKTVEKYIHNIPRIKKYKAMLNRYRETLIHHQHYHAGHPTSQALMDAESLAYAGFTM